MTEAFESYVALAREDLEAARALVRHASQIGHAAFHVEQAAEKLIKAVLTVEGIAFPTTHHQLGYLVGLLPADHEWRADFASFDAFTPYATKYRYPTPSGKLPLKPKAGEIAPRIDEVADILDDVLAWCREAGMRKAGRRGR